MKFYLEKEQNTKNRTVSFKINQLSLSQNKHQTLTEKILSKSI